MSKLVQHGEFRKNIASFIDEVNNGEAIILMRHHKPMAVVISMQEFAELQLLREEKNKLAIMPLLKVE